MTNYMSSRGNLRHKYLFAEIVKEVRKTRDIGQKRDREIKVARYKCGYETLGGLSERVVRYSFIDVF